MGQVEIAGPARHDFLQRVLSNDLDRLGDGQAQYTLLTNERGRHRRRPDRLPPRARRLPAGRERRQHRGRRGLPERAASDGVPVVDRSAAHGMIALQGPTSRRRAGRRRRRHPAVRVRRPRPSPASRASSRAPGYTGERGVEIVTPAGGTVAVWDAPAGGRRGAVRARRARHAAARGLLPAARQRHHAEHQRDRGRPRLGVRAAEGLHRRRRAAPDEGGGPGRAARGLPR